MLKRATRYATAQPRHHHVPVSTPSLRFLHTSRTRLQAKFDARSSGFTGARDSHALTVGGIAASVVVFGWVLASERGVLHADAIAAEVASAKGLNSREGGLAGKERREDRVAELDTFVWGSNRGEVILPSQPGLENARTPTAAPWLQGVALRDLAFHKAYGACVDARGDVYMWGYGYDDSEEGRRPNLTLRGKNIKKLQLTESRVYALAASGHVYAFESNRKKQELRPGEPTPASSPWWGTGWFWGEEENIDFIQITPKEKLPWGEKFISISSGMDHVLALTSAGRTFAHPVNKKANLYGQLGFRKFEISVPPHRLTEGIHHLPVELIPKSIADPFVSSSSTARTEPVPVMSENLKDVDDGGLRFCTNLYEIKTLVGVEVAEAVAGGRSSFVRTKNGKVLAWGANEYGQLGLGVNVALETITIPTEVILWRGAPSGTQSKCLGVAAGGDLTSFTVERFGRSSPIVDLLMCGNGRFGGLGNNSYSSSQGDPIRVKTVSGLQEYDDKTQSFKPIRPEHVSVSPSGHVLLTLDTSEGGYGRDLLGWGKNYESELGNGKKSSVAVPANLEGNGERVMLRRKKATEVRDMNGKVWKKGVDVEQRAVAGYENSAVYWRIL